MINVGEILLNLWQGSGFNAIFSGFTTGGWQNLVMLIIACVLLYLGIVKKFEPLLLVGIAFGCLLSNLPLGGADLQDRAGHGRGDLFSRGGGNGRCRGGGRSRRRCGRGGRGGGRWGHGGHGLVLVHQHSLSGLHLHLVGAAIQGHFIFHFT